MRILSERALISTSHHGAISIIFQNFSLCFPQVVSSLLITFQFFPTLFNIIGKLVEKF